MIPTVQFALWLDDVAALMALEPSSRAYKKALAALQKDMDLTPEELSSDCVRWDRAMTVSTLIGLLAFIGMIAMAIWGKHFLTPGSTASEAAVWSVVGLLLLADTLCILFQLKINRIGRMAFQSAIDRLCMRMQQFPSKTLKHAQRLYRNDSGEDLLEYPCHSELRCGCYGCKNIFPARNFDWNRDPDYPLCPHCHSAKYLVYDGKKAALTTEGLSVLHTLFIEE